MYIEELPSALLGAYKKMCVLASKNRDSANEVSSTCDSKALMEVAGFRC